jgi:hypothetical protein
MSRDEKAIEPRRGVTYQLRATPWVRIETEIEP